MSTRPDFVQGGRALIDLQFKLMRDARTAMATNTQRMQEDVDAILHAFAMMPVAADRILRAAALKSTPEQPAPAKSTRAPATRKPRSRRASGEHAR